jgi:carbon storage regulator
MLVLSRKEGQTIVVGDGIEIQVAAIQGNRVRIAVNAPASVRVLRGELVENGLISARKDQAGERRGTVTARQGV